MTPELMRKEIKKVYNNEKWSSKVDRMLDNQVMAIYFRMLKDGEFEKKESEEPQIGRQLTFNDILKGE